MGNVSGRHVSVVSAQRAQAFEACRWIIDTLKKTVPIWKKEYFEDSAVRADGEPFPAEISMHGIESDCRFAIEAVPVDMTE